jgi:ketosteroid isomerase-like protein
MKPLILVIIILLFSFGTKAQNVEKETAAIKAVLTDFFETFTHPDIKYFDRNCSPDFQLIENGEIWERKEIQAYVDKMTSQPLTFERTNQFDFIKVKINKNTAWVNYYNTATIKSLKDGSVKKKEWIESIILEKTKGKWIIQQMHNSVKK